jgi:two-component system NarL family sensor kinase
MTTYAALGQYQKAFQRAQDIMALRDSAAKKRTEEAVYDLNIQYQSAEKERENQRLRAEKAETELALQEAKNRSRLFYLGLLLSLGVLAALVLAFIYFRKNTLQEQKLLTFQAIVRGEESERRRLARDLHDSLGGILATVERQFGQLAENMEALQNHPPLQTGPGTPPNCKS